MGNFWEYANINDGHTYRRERGTHTYWTDEQGNIVNLKNGKTREVIKEGNKRVGSGGIAYNPDIYILDGKGYKDHMPGSTRMNYWDAIRHLNGDITLGWSDDKNFNNNSRAAISNQVRMLNKSGVKLKNGNVGFIDVRNNENPLQIWSAQDNSYDENPNIGFVYPQDEISAISYATDVAQMHSQGGTLYKKYFI